MTYARPNIPYAEKALPNNTRYESLTQQKRPLSAKTLDGEINYVVDSLNDLETKINNAVIGKIPGSSEIGNKDKLVTNDGTGNLSWIEVTTAQLQDRSVTRDKIYPGAVGAQELDTASVTTDKIYDQNITTTKIKDGAIDNNKIAPLTIDGEAKIKGGSIPANKIKGQPNSYGIMSIFNGVGNAIAGTTAPGYFLRTEGISGLTKYGRITSDHLDAGIVGETQLGANAVTSGKIKDGAITNAKLAAEVSPSKLKGTGNNIVTTTGPGYQGSGIGLTSALNKVMCSKGVAPFGEFRSLGPADLPNIGMQPVYMANFNADGTLVNAYNPFNLVSNFGWVSPTYYQISLADNAAKFVALGTAFINSPYVVNFKIIEKNDIYVRFRFCQQVGDSVSNVQSAGSIILYKIA